MFAIAENYNFVRILRKYILLGLKYRLSMWKYTLFNNGTYVRPCFDIFKTTSEILQDEN